MKRELQKLTLPALVAFLLVFSAGFSVEAQQDQNQNQQEQKGFSSIEQIRSEMNSVTITTVDFNETSLDRVIQYFRDQVSFNIIVKESVDTTKTVSLQLNDIPLNRLMKIVLDQNDLTASYQNGVVQIVPAGEMQNLQVRAYDVRDLQLELQDFPGPRLRLRDPEKAKGGTQGGFGSGGGGGEQGSFLGGAFESQGQGGGGGNPITDTNQFMELVKNNTGGQNWRQGSTMHIKNGIMIVKQTPEVHREILYLINRLRKFK